MNRSNHAIVDQLIKHLDFHSANLNLFTRFIYGASLLVWSNHHLAGLLLS